MKEHCDNGAVILIMRRLETGHIRTHMNGWLHSKPSMLASQATRKASVGWYGHSYMEEKYTHAHTFTVQCMLVNWEVTMWHLNLNFTQRFVASNK